MSADSRADRFEAAGVVLGSAVMLALPTSAFFTVFYEGVPPSWTVFAWPAPGIVVGWLAATRRLHVTYTQVWAFGLLSYAFTFAAWLAAGEGFPPTNRPLALLGWVVGVVAAAAFVRFAPRVRSG